MTLFCEATRGFSYLRGADVVAEALAWDGLLETGPEVVIELELPCFQKLITDLWRCVANNWHYECFSLMRAR